MRFKALYVFILLAVVAGWCSSCKKTTTLSSGGKLVYSIDTLEFDTVFTAAGSFTTSFKIFNPQNQDVVISGVRLAEGTKSYFHLNVDGFQGNTQANLRIRAHDSIYVFATVNIDPNNAQSPFIITDSFIATMNGQNFILPFTAYGQNAHYIVDSNMYLPVTYRWGYDDKLPYVIIHNAEVDSFATLDIAPGTKIYVNQDSRLFVLGTMHVNGTQTDTVVFQGDRLDRFYFGYQGYPGEWGGLYFDGASSGSTMSYTRLLNCGGSTDGFLPAAIQVNVDTFAPGRSQLKMDHCIIQNSAGYGVVSFGGCIHMDNCLINTCGAQAVALIQGGYDTLVNCTFACFGTDKVAHTDNGTVAILNYYAVDQTHVYHGNLNTMLINCIIWGGLSTEIAIDSIPGGTFNLVMQNCLYRADSIERFAQPKLTNCIANTDPVFKNPTNFDFHISTSSPAAAHGLPWSYLTDLDGTAWNNSNSTIDVGCYKAK